MYSQIEIFNNCKKQTCPYTTYSRQNYSATWVIFSGSCFEENIVEACYIAVLAWMSLTGNVQNFDFHRPANYPDLVWLGLSFGFQNLQKLEHPDFLPVQLLNKSCFFFKKSSNKVYKSIFFQILLHYKWRRTKESLKTLSSGNILLRLCVMT